MKKLITSYPDQTQFRKNVIVDTAKAMGYRGPDFYALIAGENRVKVGTYDLTAAIESVKPTISTDVASTIDPTPNVAKMQSIVNDERSFAKIDPTFVPWGAYNDVLRLSNPRCSTQYIFLVYLETVRPSWLNKLQLSSSREFIRVQINPETDEDDLIGGFRLINGETVFSKGPVLKAMENGAISIARRN